jgi:LacI family transcriptional regulator
VAGELRRSARVRPTAVITNSDYLAHAVYLAAADRGLRVPDDLSVLGHDDLPTSASLSPALSTIAVDRREIGERAAGLLVAALGDQRPADGHLTVPVQLRARASTAPPPDLLGQSRGEVGG